VLGTGSVAAGSLELIVNAKSYKGVQTYRRELLITSRKGESGEVVVACGPGQWLDPKDADRIFDPFYSTKPEAWDWTFNQSKDHRGPSRNTLATERDKGVTILLACHEHRE